MGGGVDADKAPPFIYHLMPCVFGTRFVVIGCILGRLAIVLFPGQSNWRLDNECNYCSLSVPHTHTDTFKES